MTHTLVYSASGPLAQQSEKVMLLIVSKTWPDISCLLGMKKYFDIYIYIKTGKGLWQCQFVFSVKCKGVEKRI